MTVSWKYKLGLLSILMMTLNVHSETLQKLESIEQTAYLYASHQAQASYDNAHVVVESLDPRLRLEACDTSLETFMKSAHIGIGSQTVGVKCLSPVAWTVYVPVKVKVLQPVVVATKPLAANQIIKPVDVKLEQLDIGGLRQGYVKKLDQIIGQQLKRSVAMGRVIKPNNVRPQKLVHRGEHITLVAKAGKMEVRMSGTALSDASLGQRVRVKNLSSKRVVEGVVDAPGIVKVTM